MVDAGHLVFNRLDDHALHVLGRGSRIAGVNRDDREVGVRRTRATPKLDERDNAKDNQRAKDRDGNQKLTSVYVDDQDEGSALLHPSKCWALPRRQISALGFNGAVSLADRGLA
jgi:hypothetical protein